MTGLIMTSFLRMRMRSSGRLIALALIETAQPVMLVLEFSSFVSHQELASSSSSIR
jgi:hypothetical protein